MKSRTCLPAGIAFVLSGMAALSFEIIWQRRMYLIFGASAPATAAILTAIFTGIGIGSLLAPRLLRMPVSPVLVLGGLELIIGLWGIAVPWLLAMVPEYYQAAASGLLEAGLAVRLMRFGLAIGPILPATMAMGATVPVMIAIVRSVRPVSWVYGLNTAGAVTGAFLTGMYAIRLVGLHHSRFLAALCNACAVLCMIMIWYQQRRMESKKPAPAADVSVSVGTASPVTPRLLGLTYFVSGFVALGIEVVWLRLLGIVNSNSTITFALALVVYLSGMAIGSLCVYPWLRRRLEPLRIFRLANLSVALLSLATLGAVYQAPYLNYSWITLPSQFGTLTYSHICTVEFILTSMLMFAPTLAMGLVYPAACDSVDGPEEVRNRWNASCYFRGTAGSVAGILMVSGSMVPWLGLIGTLSVLCVLSSLVFAIRAMIDLNRRAVMIGSVLTVTTGVWAIAVAVDPQPVLRDTIAGRGSETWFEYALPESDRPTAEIVRFKAGPSATVITKKEIDREDYLVYVDDQLVASTNLAARVDAFMLAHLPLLLHDDPQNALTVGFGTGGTSHALTTHGIDAFCAEIEPEVPRSAHLLESQNFRVLEHPRFELILNDARDHLGITSRRYDMIATDVTNLQYKQNSNLYTVEYFQLMQQRLTSNGIACAWIPMAAIEKRELQILMKSFQTVFPHATLWFMNHTHTNFGILIGTPETLQIDYRRVAVAFEDDAIRDNLELVGVTAPMQLIHCLHLDEDAYRTFCGDVPLHTDNDPILEFTSPLSFFRYNDTFVENMWTTLSLRPRDISPWVVNGPAADDEQWEQHRIASDCGCQVILGMYQFLVHRRRGDHMQAVAALQRAVPTAEAGLKAWPEDPSRETFYSAFFSEAERWLQSPQAQYATPQ